MRATALLLAGSCIVASVIAAPSPNGAAAKALIARGDDHEHHNGCQHHDGNTDCDTDDDGWDTENDCPTPGWIPPEHRQDTDCDDDDDDDEGEDDKEPPCPDCPPPPPACHPRQSVANPGFEDNGGMLAPWRPSDPSTVLIDSQHGEPDAHGAHSALFLLNAANTAASISQHIDVCPHAVYRIYLAIRIAALNNAASTTRTSGGLRNNADCTIFTGIRDAGNATIPGASLTPGAYTAFTTANTFVPGDDPHSKIYVAISCAPSAFNSSVSAASFYIDNVQLLPEPRR